MNDKVFVLVLLLCSAVPLQLLHAHHTYISEQNAWELAEQRLGNAIGHFTRTEAERNNIHTKWDINNEHLIMFYRQLYKIDSCLFLVVNQTINLYNQGVLTDLDFIQRRHPCVQKSTSVPTGESGVRQTNAAC